ncbi:zinc finger BED domain-containing protein RICESLEEPER 1-like isoform X1 [Aphis craccivora]|uniref:Zinc finger BED domain-containing protein RICESLEEPER 1-like isoform X1 n=1 Tax=Aphis craccivora TaxID=307492 RepID=A0A6G0W498_APHCR|nr:zinc finger BED domain-containing protein RICESLEEPER 1-like isoform X1 [Aphis craccivora]
MGRKSVNPVSAMFFDYNKGNNTSKCKISDCPHPIMKGKHPMTLEKHVEHRHPESYLKLVKAKERIQNLDGDSDNDDYDSRNKKLKTGPLDKVFSVTKKSLYIRMDKEVLLKACAELVTVNGRPLTIFKDCGMQKILKPITQVIGDNFTINPQNIRIHIMDEAEKIINTIKKDTNNRLVSLKMDCVSRLNRGIIGINIQYQINNKLVIRTLAMSNLEERHTSDYLKSVVLKVLNRYDIRPDQVYSCTVDNGANMVKMVRLRTKDNQNDNIQVDNIDEIIEENIDEDDDSDILANNQYSVETELFNDDIQEHLVHSLKSTGLGMTFCIRCSAHTIQLCVFDGINKTNIKEILVKARKVVKKLRTPTVSTMLKKKKLNKAILDCDTRWNSIYDMLHRLYELKPFCELIAGDISELELNNDDWELIKSLVSTLEPVKIGSNTLQKADLTIGDFYGCWWKVRNGLSKVNTELSKAIQDSMIKRQVILMFNDIFVSENQTLSQRENECTPSVDNDNVETDDFELFLKSRSGKFDDVQRIPYDSNIRDYWRLKEKEMPEFYEISQVLMSIPATQVSVERSFSSLKFILSDLRGNLSPTLLESIMILKCNTQFKLATLNN